MQMLNKYHKQLKLPEKQKICTKLTDKYCIPMSDVIIVNLKIISSMKYDIEIDFVNNIPKILNEIANQKA